MSSRPILLLIDNDLEVLATLDMLLGDSFEVVLAPTAGAALGMVAVGLEPDVVLVDVYLERMDGMALRAELPAWMRKRVVLMAANPVRGSMASAIRAIGAPMVHHSRDMHLLEPILKAVA